MRTNTKEPTVTKKFHIEVPTHIYDSVPAVYKIYFGKHYLIWKGKSLLQSCENIAESIERYLRLNKNDETDYLYHVCNHIKRTRCIKATVEVIANDFQKDGSETVHGLNMLKLEQELLDSDKSPLCLNNNAEAYIPRWITKPHLDRFYKFLEDRKPKKKKSKKDDHA